MISTKQEPTRLIIKNSNMSFMQVGLFAVPFFLALITAIGSIGVNDAAALWACSTCVWIVLAFYFAYETNKWSNLTESLLIAIRGWVQELKEADEEEKKGNK